MVRTLRCLPAIGALANAAIGFNGYIATMRRTLWMTLLTFALTLGALGSGARGASLPMRGGCCETMCADLPACGNTVVCQACATPAAQVLQHRVLTSLHRPPFPKAGNDQARTGPAPNIWTPPD